ncbi:MAG: hypothetical protein E4H14_05780 [Candidatus Thorarchaeota archaeon]|nr:MAG: hypothetical protein E4H14_05780 [Candidatus Thorarchaeota archaeon]
MNKAQLIDIEMKKIESLITDGQYEIALVALQAAQAKHPNDLTTQVNALGFLIDIGSGLGDQTMIRKAIDAGTDSLKRPIPEELKGLLPYWLGNGYLELFAIALKSNEIPRLLCSSPEIQNAKKFLRMAIATADSVDSEIQVRIHTNYANLLDNLGRRVEALLEYDKAINIDKNHLMARGNQGMALKAMAPLCGPYEIPTYVKAYQTLVSVNNDPDSNHLLDARARAIFQECAEMIEKGINNPDVLNMSTVHQRYDDSSMSEFERFYVSYCSEKSLFMNFHFVDCNCEASIVDPVFISHYGPLSDQKAAHELFKSFNQMKEDYMSARLMLVESQYRREDLDSISMRTLIADTYDYSAFNIYIAYLKAAFKQAYGILDKIAVFVNKRYGIGLCDRRIAFDAEPGDRSVWVDESGNPREKIVQANNIYLHALYDISSDFRNGTLLNVKVIRNALVHRKLTVQNPPTSKLSRAIGKESILYEDLLSETESLLQLVKAALIYLIAAVDRDISHQKKKHGDARGTFTLGNGQYLD